MRTWTYLVAAGAIIFWSVGDAANAASMVAVEAPENSSKEPTMTMLFEAQKAATGTIMLIPGGSGRLGFTEQSKPAGPFVFQVLMPLVMKSGYNAVIVDNPFHINNPSSGQPGNDRLDRIESVTRFYREKFNVPVILWGHSNGTAAIIELINRSPDTGKMLAGIVLSGKRKEYDLNTDVKIPVLFIHHRNDGCDKTPYGSVMSDFERLKKAGFPQVTLATIEGGTDSGSPCVSGHHMFQNAHDEVLRAFEWNMPR